MRKKADVKFLILGRILNRVNTKVNRAIMDEETSDNEEWNKAWDEGEESKQESHLSENIIKDAASSVTENVFTNTTSIKLISPTKPSTSNDQLMSRMLLNDNKAGMEGLDKEKINQIIYEASKGSKYFLNEQKKEEAVNARIVEQKQKQSRLTTKQIREGERAADILIEELEKSRDLNRTIVHIDMDAFYAAVEMRDDPSLKNKPMAVGGSSMLSTSNYIARRFGVRAAMPGFIGKKLCPQLTIVPPNFTKYTETSNEIRSIMEQYDPNYSPMSLDEAFLDMTPHITNRKDMSTAERSFIQSVATDNEELLCTCTMGEMENETEKQKENLNCPNDNTSSTDTNKVDEATATEEIELFKQNGKAVYDDTMDKTTFSLTCDKCKGQRRCVMYGCTIEGAVAEMRFRIHQKTRLTASAGIGTNTLVAKICSDKNKPNGQFRVMPTQGAIMSFILDLPIRKVFGIGKVSEKMLSGLGINYCRDIHPQRGTLYHLYSDVSFKHFINISLGLGSTTVSREGERKSMSVERTFSEIRNPKELYAKCQELCSRLAEDLQEENLSGKTVTLKIKTTDFHIKVRASSVAFGTKDETVIYNTAKDILRAEIESVAPRPLALRLMGVRMSNFTQKDSAKQETILGLFSKMGKQCKSEATSTLTSVQGSTQVTSSTMSTSPVKTGAHESSALTVGGTDRSPAIAGSSLENTAKRKLVDDNCDNMDVYMCPVCDNDIECSSLEQFNRHIDECITISPSARRAHTSCSLPTKLENASVAQNREVIPDGGDSKYDFKVPSGTQTLGLNDPSNPDNVSVKTPYTDKTTNDRMDSKQSVKTITSPFKTNLSKVEINKADSNVLVCPVCSKPQLNMSLGMFNSHVDDCLNKQTIKEMLSKEKDTPWTSNIKKRSSSDTSAGPSKRAKTSKGDRTLESFFKRKDNT